MSGSAAGGSVVRWEGLLDQATERLAGAGVVSAAAEARRIVAAAAGSDDGDWHGVLPAAATRRGVASFDAMLARRVAGEPLQYVLGSWGFRTLDLFVDRRVLIPRPETETLVGCALDELQRRADALVGRPEDGDGGSLQSEDGDGAPFRSSDARRRVVAARRPAPPSPSTLGAEASVQGARVPVLLAVDLGCGSGAIGLSLVAERSDTEVICTDVSADALAVTSANLAGLGRPARRVRLAEGSWFEALPVEQRGRFDVIASNPPYIAPHDPLPPEVADHEPAMALYSGSTGLEATATILAGAPSWLAPGGAVVLEMADGTAGRVRELAGAAGLVDIAVHRDLAGRERVLVARRPS